MVLTLYLIRHAKSSWKDADTLDDRNRPLAKRGKRDVKLVAKALAERDVRFEAVLSSPAKRARATCRRVCKAVKFPRDAVETKKTLYFCGAEQVLATVKHAGGQSGRVLAAFGHNPDWSDFVKQCAAAPPLFSELPTCGVAVIHFACDKVCIADCVFYFMLLNFRHTSGARRVLQMPNASS